MLTGAFLAGVGLLIALPVAVRGAADLVIRHSGGVTARLAARRLQAEPASTVRTVAGLTIAVFLITGASGVLAAFQAVPQYASARQAYEQGPQHHLIIARPASWADTGRSNDTRILASLKALERQLRDAAGVRSVIPTYDISVAGCEPESPCGNARVHPDNHATDSPDSGEPERL